MAEAAPARSPARTWLRRLAIALGGGLLLLGALALLAFRTSLFLSDLRDGPLGVAADGEAARQRLHAAHGGLDRWLGHGWVELTLTGEVPAAEAAGAFGVSGDHPRLTLRFDPCDRAPFTQRIVDGSVITEGPITGQSEAHQMLGYSIRHLFELPFAMHTADVIHSLPSTGDAARVFMSWGRAEPQMKTDQYILELGPDGRVRGFEATVRAVAPFIRADVDYAGWVEADGITLPRDATVRDPLLDRLIHRWRLESLTLGPPRADPCPG